MYGAKVGPGFPLFPDRQGHVMPKLAMIARIRQGLRVGGVQVQRVDRHGIMRERYWGHVLRVSGAQMMALMGAMEHVIKLYGRWGSTAVGRYIQDAPLRRPPVSTDADSSTTTRGLEKRLAALETNLRTVIERTQELEARKVEIEAGKGLQEPDVPDVVNAKSGVLHRGLIEARADYQGTTWCGWRYRHQQVRPTGLHDAAAPKCERCFRSQLVDTSSSDDTGGGGE